ncbi:ABC transporter ATP-binding protein [Desulfomicrobium escambiense]|uniref:ABC transporter ATP-binding protein n=1 Tax=Desulfomicrobium escambiense TaxID=29503 RepID=UPI00048D6260|nr:ABC transporter ATP-binding protein [Desulfomicrobium escambiense]
MSSDIAIKVDHLSKCYQIYDKPRDRLMQMLMRGRRQYYREFWALKDVSFEVRKGECVGIVGRNGSGKSTLLQLICGTLRPTCGHVITSGRIAALLELGSGFSPEFSGRENVYLNGCVLGLSRAEIDARFDTIADFADIGAFMDQPVKSYSSGMVVRLAFAVAINVDPLILVVDEALSVGDELFQRKCFSRIEAIRRTGATVLFVSHSGVTVVDLCDRAILLDGGDLLTVGRPKRVVGSYQKLLYAPAQKREAIRASIAGARFEDEGAAFVADPFGGILGESVACGGSEEIFDSGFIPQSTMVFESRGAHIGDARIFTLDGRQVNGLIRGRRYCFRYDVRFERAVTNVRFSMLIKTGTGMPLGGGLSAASQDEGLSVVEAGEGFEVDYFFNCHLNPGVYFVNSGVFGCDGSNEEVVLHRKADVLAFRVLPVPGSRATEIVDFGFECSWSVNG